MILLFAGLTDFVLKKEVSPALLKKSLQVAIELSAAGVLSTFCCWMNILKIMNVWIFQKFFCFFHLLGDFLKHAIYAFFFS